MILYLHHVLFGLPRSLVCPVVLYQRISLSLYLLSSRSRHLGILIVWLLLFHMNDLVEIRSCILKSAVHILVLTLVLLLAGLFCPLPLVFLGFLFLRLILVFLLVVRVAVCIFFLLFDSWFSSNCFGCIPQCLLFLFRQLRLNLSLVLLGVMQLSCCFLQVFYLVILTCVCIPFSFRSPVSRLILVSFLLVYTS